MCKWLRVAALLLLAAGSRAAPSGDALTDAIAIGDRRAVEALIEEGTAVNATDSLGTTPLMWAARYGDAVIVDRLIDAGADVTAENAFGATAMSEAALIGSTPVIRRLLEGGVDANASNAEGETALMLVARTGNIEAANLLFDAGADVNATERWGGQTALMWAVAQLQPDMVKLLLAKGAHANARATVRDWDRKVTAEPRPKTMSQGGLTPLLYAARVGCRACAELLLEGGADIDLPDPYGITPLMMAILNLHVELATYLMDAGADIQQWDLFGRTPLYLAIDMKDYFKEQDLKAPAAGLTLARLLLERGANPNSQLKQWRPPFVRLSRGQDNTLSAGATPLLRAAHASDIEAMQLLLRHGALVDLPNASGVTPLMAAAGLGVSPYTERAKSKTEEASLEVVRLLLDAGADVNKRTFDPRRIHTDRRVRESLYGFVFQMAFRYAYLPPNGRTALHGAAEKGWNRIIDLLVENGAEIDVVDATGKTPWDLAQGNYEPAITVPPADPFEDTMALLEAHCRRADDCDYARLVRTHGG